VERYQFRRAPCFFGFVHCFWHSEDKKGTPSKAVDKKKHCLYQTDFSVQQWQGIGSFKFFMSFVSMTKLQQINGDQQTNKLQSEMYLQV
jgi:hypothetical protein